MRKPRDLPTVSDHAVLRYLERALNVPVETIREQLAASAAIGIAHEAAIVKLGSVKLVIRGGTVVTCLRKDMRFQESKRGRQKEADDE